MSDLVVLAHIEKTDPGRIVGDEISSLQFTETKLDIEEQLSGSRPSGELLVETEHQGAPYTNEWRQVGETVVAFLWLKRDDESAGRYHRPLIPESVFLVDGDDVEPTVDSNEWNLESEIASLTLPELLSEIRGTS